MAKIILRVVAIASFLACVGIVGAQPFASDYSGTPVFTDDFKKGGVPAPQGNWKIDPHLALSFPGLLAAPQFVGSTPAGLNAAFVSANPVGTAPAADNAVMMVGNTNANNASTAGLSYNILFGPTAGDDLTTFGALNNYRFVARLYLAGTSQTTGRFQVGVYCHSGITSPNQPDLFRAGPFYNTDSTGGGPGFGSRGTASNTQTFPVTSALTTGRWTLMSVMVKDDTVSVCVDANGDGNLNEADPLEYQAYGRDTADFNYGFPAVWTVDGGTGIITNDTAFPLFVDDVALYLPVVAGLQDWFVFE